MPNFEKMKDTNEAAKIYLQMLARALAAAPNQMKIAPYRVDDKTDTLNLTTVRGIKSFSRQIVLKKQPTPADFLTTLNVIYDLLEVTRGNKMHYEQGSNLTSEQMLNSKFEDVDAYMEEFNKLASYKKVEEYGTAIDETISDPDLQILVAIALGAQITTLNEMTVSSPKRK